MQAEISYDLIMDDDMPFVEGTYRLAGGEWQVFIFIKEDIDQPRIASSRWWSGVTGCVIHVPSSQRLSKVTVEGILQRYLNVNKWVVVQGPDSMQIR